MVSNPLPFGHIVYLCHKLTGLGAQLAQQTIPWLQTFTACRCYRCECDLSIFPTAGHQIFKHTEQEQVCLSSSEPMLPPQSPWAKGEAIKERFACTLNEEWSRVFWNLELDQLHFVEDYFPTLIFCGLTHQLSNRLLIYWYFVLCQEIANGRLILAPAPLWSWLQYSAIDMCNFFSSEFVF